MRNRVSIVCAAAALLMAIPAIAQNERPNDGPSRRGLQRADRGDRPRGGLRGLLDRMRSELNLTEEQQEEFKQIVSEYREKNPRGEKEGGGFEADRKLLDEIREAREAGDSVRARELQQQLRERRTPPNHDELFDAIEKILDDEQKAKLSRIRDEYARGQAQSSPSAQLNNLKNQLDLDDEQAGKWDALFAEYEGRLNPKRPDPAEMEELVKQIREAAESGDDERIAELREQLGSNRGGSQQAIDDFLSEVEEFLNAEQMEVVSSYRERREGPQSSQDDLRKIFAAVQRIDLDPDQKVQVREIRQDAMQAMRDARRDPAQMSELTEKTKADLREVLNEEQAEEFDRLLAADGRARGGPDAKQRPGKGAKGKRGRDRAEKQDDDEP